MTNEEIKKYYETVILLKKEKEGLLNSPYDDEIFMSIPIDNFDKMKCLDLGYGVGNYSVFLAQRGASVTAVDLIDSNILKNKITKLNLRGNINIFEKDISKYCIRERYDLIIAKNIFHYLQRDCIDDVIKNMILGSNVCGYHYFNCFTNITRFDRNGKKLYFENEARYSTQEFIDYIVKLYKNWQVKYIVSQYSEDDECGKFKYFISDVVNIIAYNDNQK